MPAYDAATDRRNARQRMLRRRVTDLAELTDAAYARGDLDEAERLEDERLEAERDLFR